MQRENETDAPALELTYWLHGRPAQRGSSDTGTGSGTDTGADVPPFTFHVPHRDDPAAGPPGVGILDRSVAFRLLNPQLEAQVAGHIFDHAFIVCSPVLFASLSPLVLWCLLSWLSFLLEKKIHFLDA